MLTNLDQSIDYIVNDSGPEVLIDPNVPGGARKYGVTLQDLAVDYAAHSLGPPDQKDLERLTYDAAREFFHHVAVAVRFNDLPSGVDYVILDAVAALGATATAMAIQGELGLDVTGTFDDATVRVITVSDPLITIDALAFLGWLIGNIYEYQDWAARSSTVRARAAMMMKG